MDKKSKKKSVIKRKSDDSTEAEKKPKIMVNRTKVEEKEDKVEPVNQVIEVQAEQAQQIVHSGQLVEGSFEQPVFVNMKGEPVQLGPNTVILYEQNGNPANFAFGGMWTMDQSGRIVMAETIYDVKGEPEEESATFVHNTAEVNSQPAVEESSSTFEQFELGGSQTEPEYEVAIIDNSNSQNNDSCGMVICNEDQMITVGNSAIRWLNQKYEMVVRKLQLNYDAGVKLLHSPNGCTECIYLTTPSMQLAFNAVPQFLCIETGIEFNSVMPTMNGQNHSIKHTVTLFMAEDGNGKSVIVSAGISALIGTSLTWLLETFKSCNPAWRLVRCVLCDPLLPEEVSLQFPSAHVAAGVWQAVRAAKSLHSSLDAALLKTYALAALRAEHTHTQLHAIKRSILGTGPGTARLWDQLNRAGGAINKLDFWLEPENYTNILHKGLERLIIKLTSQIRREMSPEEFVSVLFSVSTQLEEDRRQFAISKLRDTESQKQSPTDTITQYAYNLMSHQTKLAQKCLDDKVGRKHSSAAIAKYGTSTQECSCLFSRVFKLPCRHILMLTTELKVKTHIPFEPRWTVQHCLFGCEQSSANAPAAGGSHYVEQVVLDSERQPVQQMHQMNTVRPQQYVLATPGQTSTPVSQVIFCGGVGSSGSAVLTPHHIHHS